MPRCLFLSDDYQAILIVGLVHAQGLAGRIDHQPIMAGVGSLQGLPARFDFLILHAFAGGVDPVDDDGRLTLVSKEQLYFQSISAGPRLTPAVRAVGSAA